MKKSIALVLVAFFAIAAPLCARTIDVRSGTLIAAEASTFPLTIQKLESSPYPVFPRPLYVVIMMRCPAKRTVGIVDYALKVGRTEYGCTAIALNTDDFTVNTNTVRPGTLDTVKLLFILNAAVTNPNNSFSATLLCKLTPGSANLVVKGLGDKNFTLPIAVPATGNL